MTKVEAISGLVEEQLGLEQLELKADRAKVRAEQEVGVLEGELIGLAFGLRARRYVACGPGVDFAARKNAFRLCGISHPRRLADERAKPKG